MFISRLYGCPCLYIIGRIDHDHSRNGPHQSDILVTLMGCSVFPDGDSCMGSSDLHIQVRISNGVSDLLKGTSCRKHGKGTCKRHFSRCCQSGCHTDHIALCDSAVNEPFWIGFLEDSCLSRCCKVCIQYNDLRMLRSKLG